VGLGLAILKEVFCGKKGGVHLGKSLRMLKSSKSLKVFAKPYGESRGT